jgi:hypothetical protein
VGGSTARKKEWGVVPQRGERREQEEENGKKKKKKRKRKVQVEDIGENV